MIFLPELDDLLGSTNRRPAETPSSAPTRLVLDVGLAPKDKWVFVASECWKGGNVKNKSYMQGKIMIHDKSSSNFMFKNKLGIQKVPLLISSSAQRFYNRSRFLAGGGKFHLCLFKAIKNSKMKIIEYLQIQRKQKTPPQKKVKKTSHVKLAETRWLPSFEFFI